MGGNHDEVDQIIYRSITKVGGDKTRLLACPVMVDDARGAGARACVEQRPSLTWRDD